MAEPLDAGSAHFDPSNLEFTSVDVGNKTGNIIPAEARARFNIRYNDVHTRDSLKALVEARAHAAAQGGRFHIDWDASNAHAFVTTPGPFVGLVSAAISEVTGRKPVLSTSGGTSDARFIREYCPVVEFGLVNQTMHGIDEHVATADLVALTAIYRKIIDRYFA
jgi:succinyl-diaminopimelate desuccinylase